MTFKFDAQVSVAIVLGYSMIFALYIVQYFLPALHTNDKGACELTVPQLAAV